MQKIEGLSTKEIKEKKLLGLSNSNVDSHSPSYFQIFLRNFFTVTTITLLPLVIAQFYFELYRDAIVISIFISASSVINTIEEIRVKKRLDALKSRFKNFAKVIRDKKEQVINAEEIVEGDYVIAEEGDSIVTDGKIIWSEFLQVDESALTGESDYVEKQNNENVLSGSFVVTGKCTYIATHVGNKNYLNKLSQESTRYKKKRSKLEKNGDKFLYLFAALGIGAAFIHYIVLKDAGFETKDTVLSLTTIIGTIIPQTLLILLVLTFVVSVTRLGRKGILVQKRGAIDDLASIDIICLDKTGTITTNDMKVSKDIHHNLNKQDIGVLLHDVQPLLYGINKTLKTVIDYYVSGSEDIIKTESFDQIPFTSKQKFSAFQVNNKSIIFGAFSKIEKFIDQSLHKDIAQFVLKNEKEGRRIITGVYFDENIISELKNGKFNGTSKKVFALALEEELNPGIEEILNSIKEQGIEIKIISGDSLEYVKKIARKVGIDADKAIDMSQDNGEINFNDNIIFARATPEDKAHIINQLQKNGRKVAMIGDGINDVIGLKQATVGIAMESGAKVARDVADIVLLKNDYRKIPDIFYEGNNIIFNLKVSTKLFFARSIMMLLITLYFTANKIPVPMTPTAAILFSFLGNTLVGYILTFSRSNIRDMRDFVSDTLYSSVPSGIIMGIIASLSFVLLENRIALDEMNTAMVITILGVLLSYTVYLLWESNKIVKNIFLIAGGYTVTMFVGIFMTILPIYAVTNINEKIFTVFIVSIGALLIHIGLRISNKYNNKAAKLSNYLVPLAFIPFALLFPSRYYYGTQPVPFSEFGIILGLITIGVIAIIAVHQIIIRINGNYKFE